MRVRLAPSAGLGLRHLNPKHKVIEDAERKHDTYSRRVSRRGRSSETSVRKGTNHLLAVDVTARPRQRAKVLVVHGEARPSLVTKGLQGQNVSVKPCRFGPVGVWELALIACDRAIIELFVSSSRFLQLPDAARNTITCCAQILWVFPQSGNQSATAFAVLNCNDRPDTKVNQRIAILAMFLLGSAQPRKSQGCCLLRTGWGPGWLE